MRKIEHLNSLRGLAAFSVALFHFIRSFCTDTLNADHVINYTPVSVFWNGHFGVAFFFVLSGYLFCLKHIDGTWAHALLTVCKRYIRLVIPILFVSLCAFLIHAAGGFHHVAAAEVAQSDWLARWYNFSPCLALAIGEPLYKAFFAFDPFNSYNPVLWTISYELFVIILVIACTIMLGNKPRWYRYATVLGLFVLLFQIEVFIGGVPRIRPASCFILGMFAGFLQQERWFEKIQGTSVGVVLFAIGLLGSAYHSVLFQSKWVVDPRMLVWSLAAMFILLGVNASARLQRILCHTGWGFFGKISYSVYLWHTPLLCSLVAFIFLRTESLVLCGAAYAAVLVPISWLTYYFVDQPGITFAKRMACLIFRRPAPVPLPVPVKVGAKTSLR